MSITFKKVEHIYNANTPFMFHALKGVDLDIPKGSFCAIIGQTGSGKSTVIQHINALLLPTKGNVRIEEYTIDATKKPKTLKPLRKKAGLVFQFPEYQLFEETIEKDIIYGPLNFGISEDDAKEIAKKMIVQVGLDTSYLGKSPFDLSGGQKRRVAIAGILAMEPDILVLDEPTAGLDPRGTKEMMQLFKSIQEAGKTIVLVTHDMNLVLEYCDRAIIMHHGKVIRQDSVSHIFQEEEYMHALGMELPLVTQFILQLNKAGYTLDPSMRTYQEVITALGGELHG